MLCLALPTLASAQTVRIAFDEEAARWQMSNGVVSASFRLSPEGAFQFQEFRELRSGEVWRQPQGRSSGLFRFRVGDQWWDAGSGYRLLAQRGESLSRGGYRRSIILQDVSRRLEVTVDLEMYERQPVLRFGTRVRSLTEEPVFITGVDMLPVSFEDSFGKYKVLRVEQWMPVENPADFEPHVFPLDQNGTAVPIESGAHGRDMGWLAVTGSTGHGLVAGWEFDGRAIGSVSHAAGQRRLQLSATIQGIHHSLSSGQEFQVPFSFLGLYNGNWDEAGWVTQRFVETALARKGPRGSQSSYVGWDSWAYGQQIKEATLRHNATIAAQLGMEVFIVDLGWARRIGDWRPDPVKFPSGLHALSEHVRGLGMKFGLHVSFAESDPLAPVLIENPDWRSSVSYGYYGADSLCLSHKPARDWVIGELARIIDEYGVDWILQDGENMVKVCTKTTHTHHPLDSNYSNAVHGLNAVVQEVQRRRPDVLWENCENGGNMMTFQMVRQYDTSILNDASGARGARQAVYGATYPFPARYAERYMPEQELDTYVTRSYMFGGSWIFMNRLAEMKAKDLAFAAAEIERFKQLRMVFQNGRISRQGPAPGHGQTDMIASYDAELGRGVAMVTRDNAPEALARVWFTDLDQPTTYLVWFASETRVLTLTGEQLESEGVVVWLPQERSAEIVYLEAMR